jgi:four helix bundle protein
VSAPFKDLIVWQRAMDLSVAVYKLTQYFPDSERFGLTNQLRRASVSVASNIAEGYGRSSKGEYLLFLGHARGSLYEVETHLDLGHRLGFSSPEQSDVAAALASEVGRMLVVIMSRVEQSAPRARKSLTAHQS